MQPHPRFAGKTAVITGAGRAGGLGESIALRLAAEGATIVISDIGRPVDAATQAPMIGALDAMENVAAACREACAPAASTHPCDVRSYAEVESLAAHAASTHGSLDIWINNAGIRYIMKPLLDIRRADWSAVIGVNLTGAFFGLRVAAEYMVAAARGGRIINIASQAAKSGFPHAQAYTASKHGLVGLVRSAAIELGPHGITVNNVCRTTSPPASVPGRTHILPKSPATPRWSRIWPPWRRAFR